MTEEDLDYSEKLAMTQYRRLKHKYAKGAPNYETKLWEYTPDQLLEHAMEEVDDLVHFLLALKDKLKDYQSTDVTSDREAALLNLHIQAAKLENQQ